MGFYDTENDTYRLGFHLNLQILSDELEEEGISTDILAENDSPRLEGVRLYIEGAAMTSTFIYYLLPEFVPEDYSAFAGSTILVGDDRDISTLPTSCKCLRIKEHLQSAIVLNLIQGIFDKYERWDKSLQIALAGANPLDDMLEASLSIFRNPVFTHDRDFYILSCPLWVKGMSEWARDPRTGKLACPLPLIHEFRFSEEYQRTLSTRGADIFSAETRGYPILYMNLVVNNEYVGRICVDELQNKIKKGNSIALEYLGFFIETSIMQHSLFQINMGIDIRQSFIEIIDGKLTDRQRIRQLLTYLKWEPNDRFLCMRMETQQNSEQMHSAVSTLGYIEAQIPEGRAFLYEKGIVIVANLSFKHNRVSEIISSLAIIVRDGLYNMGASSEFSDFYLLRQSYIQATKALSLGKSSSSMRWCYRFDDYLLDYLLTECSQMLDPELIAASRLGALIRYDQKNNTDFYHTLRVYVENERNVLQTAKQLFIHRSSLFYRLERIEKITRLNLDDQKERLILQLCFHLLERKDALKE